MSVITTIYDALETYPRIRELLNNSSIDPSKKAIYDEWADNRTSFPYVVMSFSFGVGEHWGKNETILNLDIFTDTNNILAEEIKDACVFALDQQTFIDSTDGAYVRCYYNRDGYIVEPDEQISHWNVEFALHHWRNSLIQHLE